MSTKEIFYSADGNIIEAPESFDSFAHVYDTDNKGNKFTCRYPLHDEARHYVKFWIHVDENSTILNEPGGENLGYVDNSDQNRLNRGLTSIDAIQTAGALAGGLAGASAAIARAKTAAFRGKTTANKASVSGSLALDAYAGTVVGAGIGVLLAGLADEKFKLTKKMKKLKNTIDLYAPPGINASYNMKWNMTDDMLISFAQQDAFDSMKKAITKPGEASKELLQAAAVSNSTFSNLTRTAKNARKDVLFNSVDNRNFQYEFQLAARSQEEAKMINQIIYLFKLYSHPEVMKGFGQFLSIYPAEFKIEYYFINDQGDHVINPYMNQISSCVCTGMNVSYASNGSYQSLMNGEPTIVNLSLRFMEIETLHQDRIRKGY
jgi:hypothetical protein